MKKSIGKDLIIVLGSIIVAGILTFVFSGGFDNYMTVVFGTENALSQQVEAISEEPYNVTALYHEGILVGYFSDPEVLSNILRQVYNERYREDFPDSSVSLGLGSYTVLESTYNVYENRDEELINYINDNQLFTIKATKIELSSGESFYVKNIEDYETAKERYLLNFIDEENYELMKNDLEGVNEEEYGTRYLTMRVVETASISETSMNPGNILKSEKEIYQFLGYGENDSYKSYTVVEFDTVPGVASKANISINNLLSINSEVLSSEDQVLSVGTELNIAKYDSPIQVVVEQESIEKETINPGTTEIEYDSTMAKGTSEVIREAKNGYKKVTYKITYVNGEIYDSVATEAEVLSEAVTKKIKVGTYTSSSSGGSEIDVDVPAGSGGDGTFAWPATGARRISCGFYCYGGHRGIDIQPKGSNSWNSPILASADGVVFASYCGGSYGCHVKIRHSGNYITVYAHMIRTPSVKAGQSVKQGQVIGNIGSTGNSTGAHLHFEIQYNGTPVNPCKYVGC